MTVTEKLVIQLLDETAGEDGAIQRQFRWAYVDEFFSWPSAAHSGSEEALLSALAGHHQPVLLLIPGAKVVTVPVAFDKKEARHFLKLLPYQLEEDVLGPVDALHFAVGAKTAEVVSTAYVDSDWWATLFQWFQDHQITIERCIADFQSLHAIENELLLWFVDGYVWGHRASGLGFSIAQPLSQAFLKDLLMRQQDVDNPWQVRVFVDDAETQEIIESHIMPSVPYEVVIGQPPMNFSQTNQLNFCSGKFGQRLPLDKWWKEAKPIAILAAAAVAVFFIASFADIYLLKQRQADNQREMIAAFRTVVPSGPSSDPVRRLKSMLGSEAEVGQSSQTVYLLSKIAPVLDQLKINLTALNYSNREQELRINIQADSFNGIEQFRQQLDQQGLIAELQSSNAADNGFQARLRIAAKEKRNG